uniref:Uncharacterized protein n=1 Tax=Anopheles christyi TaxID=43041 RepID=A0A182KBT1_9DIPT
MTAHHTNTLQCAVCAGSGVRSFDGGQRQWFVMEIYDLQTHALLANVSSKLPIFTVNGLDAGLLLKIVIYATNMRGRSEPILLQAYTLKAAEKQTARTGVASQ